MKDLALLAMLAGLAACRESDAAAPGMIDVAWTGADTGQLRVAALARWCASDSLVEITGASGDSGVALAVMPADTSVSPGVFEVGMPLRVLARPGARVALRWPGETFTEGFYGLSGSLTIDSGSGLRGSLEATLRSANDDREIRLTGSFQELTLQPGSPESCGMQSPGAPEARIP